VGLQDCSEQQQLLPDLQILLLAPLRNQSRQVLQNLLSLQLQNQSSHLHQSLLCQKFQSLQMQAALFLPLIQSLQTLGLQT